MDPDDAVTNSALAAPRKRARLYNYFTFDVAAENLFRLQTSATHERMEFMSFL